MMRSLFAAISGLRAHQLLLDVTANNIANVNTVGYKSERVSFKDALSQMQQGAGAPVTGGLGGTNARQVGLGVQVGSIDNVMTSGAIQATGSPFDVAIQGKGWFQLSDVPTDTAGKFFTRSGNFAPDRDGRLVNPDGYYLLGAAGAITIDPTASSVSIAPNGQVIVDGAAVGTIQLAAFNNESGLVRASGNRFQRSPNSDPGTITTGAPGSTGFGSLSAGTVEMSNVDLAQEFTNMITAQRGFQANGRVITATDEVLQELVNLKR